MRDYSGTYIRRSMPQPYVHHVSHLLSHYTFTLPSYQRNYQWGEREASLLLHDIMNLIHGGEPLHYFGEAVYYHKPYSYGPVTYVVDSQQRTITSLVLLTAIREQAMDIAKKYKTLRSYAVSFINKINGLILNHKTQRDNGATFQITHADTTGQKAFKRDLNLLFVTGSADFPATNDNAVKHLQAVYTYFNRALHLYVGKQRTTKIGLNLLEKIYYGFVDGFYLSDIQTGNAIQALTIYITLNTRNRPLSLADIIKAQLSAIIRKDDSLPLDKREAIGSHVMQEWNDIVSALDNDDHAVISFISDYWYAAHSGVAARILPSRISKMFRNARKISEFVGCLYQMRFIYKSLYFPRTTHATPAWFKGLRPTLILMHDLQHTYANDVILGMYHSGYSHDDVVRVMRAVKRCSMRHIFTNREHYSLAAKYAWYHTKNLQGILYHLIYNSVGTQGITDEAVYDDCANYRHVISKSSTKQNNLIRYVLTNYYHMTSRGVDFSTPEDVLDKVFRDRRQSFNEYVPLKLSHNSMKDWYGSLGNVALVESDLLKKMTTDSLSAKAVVLGRSHLKANIRLGEELSHIENSNHRDTDLTSLIIRRNRNIAKNFVKMWH